MFELLSYKKFRDTPSVQFFDITIATSNVRDLVYHNGPATSPNNADNPANNKEAGAWQFYLHPNQEDNLLSLQGGRTFFLVNFSWDRPFHIVRLDANSKILRIPPNTFHRSISDPDGSLVLNQAVRTAKATVKSEFRVYNSAEIPRLARIIELNMNRGVNAEFNDLPNRGDRPPIPIPRFRSSEPHHTRTLATSAA
jgi:hypothetical protein